MKTKINSKHNSVTPLRPEVNSCFWSCRNDRIKNPDLWGQLNPWKSLSFSWENSAASIEALGEEEAEPGKGSLHLIGLCAALPY